MSDVFLFIIVFGILTVTYFLVSLLLWLIFKFFGIKAGFNYSLVFVAGLITFGIFSGGVAFIFLNRYLAFWLAVIGSILVFIYILKVRFIVGWSKIIGSMISYVFILIWLALFIVQPIRLAFTPVIVSGESMSPTLHTGDYMIMSRANSSFERGDIIVFRFGDRLLVKRLVGLPHDNIRIYDNSVYINENLLNESYLPNNQITPGYTFDSLSDNEYFVLGDNRLEALDSRQIGPIEKSAIVGKIIFH